MIRFGTCGCGGFIETAVLPMMCKVPGQAGGRFLTRTQKPAPACVRNSAWNTTAKALRSCSRSRMWTSSMWPAPTSSTSEQVIAAANAGKHVFCQKPMGMNAQECEEMVAACEKTASKWDSASATATRRARARSRPCWRRALSERSPFYHFSFNLGGYNPETAGWRCVPKFSGGGPLMDLAPHPSTSSTTSPGRRSSRSWPMLIPERNAEQNDNDAYAVMELSNGARAAMDVSFVRGNIHNYTHRGVKGPDPRHGHHVLEQ